MEEALRKIDKLITATFKARTLHRSSGDQIFATACDIRIIALYEARDAIDPPKEPITMQKRLKAA